MWVCLASAVLTIAGTTRTSENGVENMNGKYTIANARSSWPTDFKDFPGGVCVRACQIPLIHLAARSNSAWPPH